MAIHVKTSNDVNQLLEYLIADIQRKRWNVFETIYVVVQTEGMKLWLRQQIAERMGIVANIAFIQPGDIIFKFYKALGGFADESLSRSSLIWLIYEILGSSAFQARYPYQAEYFQTSPRDADVKRVNLAQTLADLYDQYQIYRSQKIEEWNALTSDADAADWQAYIWYRIKQQGKNKIPDKTVMCKEIFEKIEQPDSLANLQFQLPIVYLFEMSIVTDYHIKIFEKVSSKGLQICFYLLNPSPDYYWQEDTSRKLLARRRLKQGAIEHENYVLLGNPLLINWGQVLKATFAMIIKENEDALNRIDGIYIEQASDSLLAKIQKQIAANSSDDVYNTPHLLAEDSFTQQQLMDGSLQVHACYTREREVEALYNYLVHLVDTSEGTISARDIVVMVNDIDKYAPYINAVFSHAAYQFRYQIADVSQCIGDTIFGAVLRLLEMSEADFTAEKILQLLEFHMIKKKFDIQDVDKIRKVVVAANIHSGINGNKDDDSYLVSWKYGLKRMMYGGCMSGEPWLETEGLYPLDVVEGTGFLQIVHFVSFVEAIISNVQSRRGKRSLSAWISFLHKMVEELVHVPGEDDENYQLLQRRIEEYSSVYDYLQEDISYDVFCATVKEMLQAEKASTRYLSEGITFCSLIPMRSIPFKIVAMLGMNADNFPRHETLISFNLMNQEYQLGDRNKKDNDKLLFLETLVSAKERLYISYLGFDIQTKDALAPSILVDELLDYIEARVMDTTDKVRDILVVKHPLHHFSTQYNSDAPKADKRLYRYQNRISGQAMDYFKKEALLPDQSEAKQIRSEHFVLFFTEYSKWLIEKKWGIYLEEDISAISDYEHFTLQNLTFYDVKKNIAFVRDEAALASILDRDYYKGAFPLKNMKDFYIEQLQNDGNVKILQAVLEELQIGGEESVIEIQFAFDDTLFQLKINGIYNNRMVVISNSNNPLKNQLKFIIKALLAKQANLDLDKGLFVTAGKIYECQIQDMPSNEVEDLLRQLLQLFQDGQANVYPFESIFYEAKRDKLPSLNVEKTLMAVKEYYPYLIKVREQQLYTQPGIMDRIIRLYDLLIDKIPQFLTPKTKN